jgi:RNA polymerase sigma factor (sigma-70 family)
MKPGHGGSIRRDLGRLFEGQSVAGMGEAQLLDRFIERRDEPAFAALVARHGPMVLGVCRRLLADPLDVEDAFQATFLIFIRRAGSIRGRDRLAPWLFGVARKVASRTRTDLIRRRDREIAGVEAIATTSDDLDRELNHALLEEIDRLPASLREPIVLCCVEGLSYEQAAQRMQSTPPAVRGRLARGRERLRERLSRRGFAPSVGLAGMLANRAAIPAKLLTMTTQIARAGTFPGRVEILAEGVIRTMIVTKSKLLMGFLLTCGVAGSGVGVYAQRGPGPEPAATATPLVSADTIPPEIDLGPEFVVSFPTTIGASEDEFPLPSARNPSPDDDRLGKLEKKLDRVLEALEGNSGFRPTPDNPVRRGAPPALPAPPAAPAPPPTFQADAPNSFPGRRAAQPAVAARGVDNRSLKKPESQIDALEKKIAQLEARIARLERNLPADELTPGSMLMPAPGTILTPEVVEPELQPIYPPPVRIAVPAQPQAPPAQPVAVPL